MGSYENIVKIEEMRKRMEDNDILSAQKILDTMEIKKIKNMSDLNLIAEVYNLNERYDEAAELYLKIYDKTKSRKSLYFLTDISIRKSNLEEAQYYLSLYQQLAPKDISKYIFRYRIDKLKGEPYETLIESLETLRKTEYLEQWAYELAKTYYKAGMEAECIRECSDIILWFGEGNYVEKAKILRSYYSGEKNKEKIIEDLKRRAMGENVDNNETDSTDASQDIADASRDIADDSQEISEEFKDEIFPAPDFMLEEETEEFEAGLKKDIEDILQSNSLQEIEEEELEDVSHIADHELVSEEIFGTFLREETVRNQLIESLKRILGEPTKVAQLIITGAEREERITLAKNITLFLNKSGRLNSTKIAKIKAEKLNTIDLISKKETLRNCCLVVEDASDLVRSTIDKTLELSQSLQGDIAIIFSETKENMNKQFQEYPELMDIFNNQVHLS